MIVRPRVAIIAGIVATAVQMLTGCALRPGIGAVPRSTSSRTVKAAMVTDTNGIDDRSFNAATWEGLKRAYADLKLPGKPRYLESREAGDYEANLATLAEQGNDIVIAVGYLMKDALAKVAPRYPKTKFVLIDETAPALPNCLSVRFREQEGCFLAGYLAGRMTKTGAVGFIGGMTGEVMTRYRVGYTAGARAAKPDVRVVSKMVESWSDVAKAGEIARDMMTRGETDIILAAAGTAGIGVLDAVAQQGAGYYAIGVDKDQDGIHPGRILTSVMKGVDTSAYDAVRAVADGRWQGGGRLLGLKEGGMKLSPMVYTRQAIPPDVLKRLDTLSADIASGKLVVPSTDEEILSAPVPGRM